MKKYLLPIMFLALWSCVNRSTEIELTTQDLVGYDWVYPSIDSPLGAWKFNIDGTFNSSQKQLPTFSTYNLTKNHQSVLQNK